MSEVPPSPDDADDADDATPTGGAGSYPPPPPLPPPGGGPGGPSYAPPPPPPPPPSPQPWGTPTPGPGAAPGGPSSPPPSVPAWGPPGAPPPPGGAAAPPGAGYPPPPPAGYDAGYGYGYGSGPVPAPRAGFGSRLGAYLLDGLIIGVPAAILFVAIANALPTEVVACTVDGRPGSCEQLTGGSVGLLLGLALVYGVAVVVLYFGIPEGTRGQSLGKRMVGIRTVDARTGAPIGTGRAIGRTLFRATVSGWLCYLGFLWMLWDRQQQTWHDKVVGSVVVRA